MALLLLGISNHQPIAIAVRSSTWAPSFLGTKAQRQNGNTIAPTRAGYTAAPTDEPPTESEWGQVHRTPVREQPPIGAPPPRPYNFPAARQTPSNASTPEHNGSRREAAV